MEQTLSRGGMEAAVPKGVLSLMPRGPGTLGARSSFPGGPGLVRAESRKRDPEELGFPLEEARLPSISVQREAALANLRNRGASMPGAHMEGKGGGLGAISEGVQRSRPSGLSRGVFMGASPSHAGLHERGLAPLPDKHALPDPEDFRAWDQSMSKQQPPWVQQILSRLDKLEQAGGGGDVAARLRSLETEVYHLQQHGGGEDKRGSSSDAAKAPAASTSARSSNDGGGGDGGAAVRGMQDTIKQMQGSHTALQAKVTALTLQVQKQQKELGEAEQRLKTAEEALAKGAEEKGGGSGGKPGGKGGAAGKASGILSAAGGSRTSEAGGGAKAAGGGSRTSDAGGAAKAAAGGSRTSDAGCVAKAAAASGELAERVRQLEGRVEAAHASAADARTTAATALDAANRAQASAMTSAATAAAAAEAVSGEVKTAVVAVMTPLLQDSAGKLAALGVRSSDAEQRAESMAAQLKALAASVEALRAQGIGGKTGGGGGMEDAASAADRAILREKVADLAEQLAANDKSIRTSFLELQSKIGVQFQMIQDEMQRALEASGSSGRGSPQQQQQHQAASQPSSGVHAALGQIQEESDDSYGGMAPSRPAPAAGPAADSAAVLEVEKTAKQAMATSSRALTEASRALAEASGATAETGLIKTTLRKFHEQLSVAEKASQKTGAMEVVIKAFAARLDSVANEVKVIIASKEQTPVLATLGAAAEAARGAPAGPGADARVPAILLDLQLLATGLGELAGRVSVMDKELALMLPILARSADVKQVEGDLRDRLQYVMQEMEGVKRGMQASMMGAGGGMGMAAVMTQARNSGMGGGGVPMGMGMGMPMGMGMNGGMGMMGQGQGQQEQGRALNKSNSVVLRRSESKRPPGPGTGVKI